MIAASGPSSFSRWEATSCCFRAASCLARTTGVSFSSVADSFTVVWHEKRQTVKEARVNWEKKKWIETL